MRTIRTGALTLEPQTAAHAEEMFAVLSDPAIYTFENQPPPSVEWLRARFERLESRRSPDGREQWLNWVVRIPPATAVGYVQATVRADGTAAIAYELASAWWGRGLASAAARAMMRELTERHGVTRFSAIARRTNLRSIRMLERLGFSLAAPEAHAASRTDPDEILMSLAVEGRC